MLNATKGVYDEWKKNGNFVRQYKRVRIMCMRGADIKSYSENMKMIEIIRPDVKKCYKTPTIRFVEMEECVMAAATIGASNTDGMGGDGDFTGEERRAKRSSIIFDDTESE